MSWFRVCIWILLAAIVLVFLGGYISQWYHQKVSSSMDKMLGTAREDDDKAEESVQVTLAPERSASQQEQELMALDVGYVDDGDDD